MTKTNFLGFIILSCLIVFAFTQSYENSVTDVNNNVSIIHHDCNCTSALGGSVSSTCRDACDCTCVSGFFTCSCACRCPNDHRTDVDVEKTFDPGERSQWEKIKIIIAREDSEIARIISTEMMDVYQLAIDKKYTEFEQRAKLLDEQFMQLDKQTLMNIYQALSS